MSRRAREWSRAPKSNNVDTEDITMKTKTNIKAGEELEEMYQR